MTLPLSPLRAFTLAAAVAACGGGDERAETPKPRPDAELPQPPEATDDAEDEPAPSASVAPGPPDPIQRVSRAMFPSDLDPRRGRIGWIPSRKAFLIAEGTRDETTRSSLSLVIATEKDADRKVIEICAPADCATDAGRTKLDAVLRAESLGETIALEPILFPFPLPPNHPVTIGALAAHVRWNKDHLDLGRKQKLVRLPTVPSSGPDKPQPVAVVASPDGSLLAFTYSLGTSGGANAPTKTAVYKVPAL
jgi:hypothetical protein